MSARRPIAQCAAEPAGFTRIEPFQTFTPHGAVTMVPRRVPSRESHFPMRAEILSVVDELKQSVGLLRRHL
jgi:hypothetical protein